MKKAIFLPLLLCSFAFASCDSAPANMEEVNELKTLLAKQDLSPILDKMFVGQFAQNYETFSSTHDEKETETQFYSYRGGGMFGCLYEVSEEAYQEVASLEREDFFDYLSRGRGSYGMLQTATVASYHYAFDEEETEKTESQQCVDFLQRLETVFGDSTVQVYNSLSYKEDLDGVYDHRQNFNGIIDKGILFDAISARALSDIFASTNLYDGQRSCETLDRVYFELLGLLKGKSDQELSDFIIKNDIRFEEDEESTLVHFKVGDEAVRAILEENDIFPGNFEGTLTYEKESGSFSAYDYKIAYAHSETDESNGDVRATTMEFKANGYSWNKKFEEDLYIEPNPTVYEDAETFLEDVVREVIPPTL